MGKLILYIRTVIRLGIGNVFYVFWYRLGIKTGIRSLWFPVRHIRADQPFFKPSLKVVDFPEEWRQQLMDDADRIIDGQLRYYTFHWKKHNNPPDWFLNPFNGKQYPDHHGHWTRLPDFHPEVGEIKNVWEASRFEWVITLSRAYKVSGDTKYLDTLNNWLGDWISRNPVNEGPNWKCGQEASIRIFNLVNASFILDQYLNPSESLVEFVHQSLFRIRNNIRYAVAQDNNHGTSEASGLFIGGLWLQNQRTARVKKTGCFVRKGRTVLENRVRRLIAPQGSFSQHSVNYHRVMLDALSFAVFWSKTLGAAPFSVTFFNRMTAASKWLYLMTDDVSGNAPNLGANDGALLLNTNSCNYRDFRPSVQLSAILSTGRPVYPNGGWNESCFWFRLSVTSDGAGNKNYTKQSVILDKGYVIMEAPVQSAHALIRAPRFRFRPSHNDVFHFDLWYQGENIIHDAGTFSYNPPPGITDKPLKSVYFHNTAAFDDYEQMPALGRFLLGDWIEADHISDITEKDGEISWNGSYTDSKKNKHTRIVIVRENQWLVEDHFEGDFHQALLRYNLVDDNYQINGNSVTCRWGTITVEGAGSVIISDSVHSLYYYHLGRCRQLVIDAGRANVVKTKIVLNK